MQLKVGDRVRYYGLMDPLQEYKGESTITRIAPMYEGGEPMIWLKDVPGCWDPAGCELAYDTFDGLLRNKLHAIERKLSVMSDIVHVLQSAMDHLEEAPEELGESIPDDLSRIAELAVQCKEQIGAIDGMYLAQQIRRMKDNENLDSGRSTDVVAP